MKEKILQRQCENYLRLKKIQSIRIPDSAYRALFAKKSGVKAYIKAIIAKYLKGVPDITILLNSGQYHCFELKSPKGGLTKEQRVFQDSVGNANFTVIRNFEEFKEKIDFFKTLEGE